MPDEPMPVNSDPIARPWWAVDARAAVAWARPYLWVSASALPLAWQQLAPAQQAVIESHVSPLALSLAALSLGVAKAIEGLRK